MIQLKIPAKIFKTNDSKTIILIRLIVGLVFLSEGIQKFLYPGIRGAGRFEKIGLPSDEGFWSMMHASRTDWAMLLGSIFLLIEGSGKYSIDHKIQKIQHGR